MGKLASSFRRFLAAKEAAELPEPSTEIPNIDRRAALLPTPELIQWAENSLYTVGKALDNYRREPDPVLAAECHREGQILLHLLSELLDRSTRL